MYAWIKQMATSNKIYPIMVDSRMVSAAKELNHAAVQYIPIRPSTMCPALMLAASRNDRVIGRTVTLVDSIRTRNGFSQSGAPSGRKWAIDFLIDLKKLDIIIANQKGNPKISVKIKCLDVEKK